MKSQVLKRRLSRSIAATTAIASALYSVPALAILPVTDALAIQWLQQIDQALSSIINAQEQSTKSLIKASGDLADANATIAIQREVARQQVSSASAYELAPNTCLMAGTAEAAKSATVGAQVATASQLQGITNRALNASRSDSNMLINAETYLKSYSSGDYQNADVMASSLLDGAGASGGTKARDYTFSQKQQFAAQAYISNATSHTPLPSLPPSQVNTDEGKKYLALQRAEAAQLSLSNYAFVHALAQDLPIQNLGTQMGNAWSQMAGKVVGNSGAPLPADVSASHFIIAEIERRFSNPQWYVDVSAASPAAVQREAVFENALMLKLVAEQIEYSKRIELLLAQISASLIASSGAHGAALSQFKRATSIPAR